MNWETYGNYYRLHKQFEDRVQEMKSAYSGTNPPMEYNYRRLHPRRTLDQYSYPSLADTEARDADQTVSKWTAANGSSNELPQADSTSRLIMVDQLWLWKVDEREFRVHSSICSNAEVFNRYCLNLFPFT